MHLQPIDASFKSLSKYDDNNNNEKKIKSNK